MLLVLCLLIGQRPLMVDSTGPERDGHAPHLRVKLIAPTHPAELEYEVWVESSQGPLNPEERMELRVARTDGFEVTPLPTSGNHMRRHLLQTTEGPLDLPIPTVRWQGTDSTWHEQSWPDPLLMQTSLAEAEAEPKAGIRQPRITLPSILMAVGITLASVVFTAWLSFRKPPGLDHLLDHPKSGSGWLNDLHLRWHDFLAERIPLEPGTNPSNMAARWEIAGLPESQTLLRLSRTLEEFRFQPGPLDQAACQAWIGEARAWIAQVKAESGKKRE